ncbi:hypothetical protein F5I97DRAFT_1846179 [Phlebopus sp. FC_14]|nr:hypothetical protein F5I97DRAFT_1846179 [Phlebopus sp. FC_14]
MSLAYKAESPRKLKQRPITSFLNSSPPSSPDRTPKTSFKPSKRKRTTVTSSSGASRSGNEESSSDSDVGAIKFEPEVLSIGDEDESPRPPKRRRNRVVTDGSLGHAVSDDSLEENIGVPVRWNRKKGKLKQVVESEEESQPRKRTLIKGVRPPTPEDDDILDDVDENQILENRLRTRGKQTAFQKNLEKLKSRKGNKCKDTVLRFSSAESSESDSLAVPIRGAKPDLDDDFDASESDAAQSSGDNDDFIVEDDTHGGPVMQLPVAFSMSTHQDLAHHFKTICQLFVHMAVRPLSERRPFFEHVLKEEQYFSVPLQVARRKLSGMRDSLVTSSVWRPAFKKALEKHPEFSLLRLDFTVPECDACHLGGRMSTLLGRASGKPYDKYDFEEVPNSEAEDDIDEEDETNRRATMEFHLGRFCAVRTQVYHTFSHWEYSLYKALQRQITDAQDPNKSFVKVAFAGGVQPPEDLHHADKVMDWLDQRGIIDMEWQRVREMMESARNLEISARRGDVDDG